MDLFDASRQLRPQRVGQLELVEEIRRGALVRAEPRQLPASPEVSICGVVELRPTVLVRTPNGVIGIDWTSTLASCSGS